MRKHLPEMTSGRTDVCHVAHEGRGEGLLLCSSVSHSTEDEERGDCFGAHRREILATFLQKIASIVASRGFFFKVADCTYTPRPT